MKVEFSNLPEQETIVITVEGDLDAEAVRAMRNQTLEEGRKTGYPNFLVDLSALNSIEGGNAYTTFDLGEQFNEIGFSVWANTAVIMPQDEEARRQIEFLHTVEINRGRGVINYVETPEEAFAWFEEMARRR